MQNKNYQWLGCALSLLLLSACSSDLQTKPESPATTLHANDKNTALASKSGPLSVVYIEVNSNNMLNAGCYTLKNSGAPFFDIAIIFAANINYDAQQRKAVLFNNPNVTEVLSKSTTYIKPLQDKGIKVLLSILGNHQGAGFANFTSRAAARDFAQQLANAVNTYNLDGIDFDDEYAEYGRNGLPQPNDSSFLLLLRELRSLIPNKIISVYDIGPSTYNTQWGTLKFGDFVNYGWNPYYGSYSAPSFAGMTKSQLGPGAINITQTGSSTVKSFAQRTVQDGYGVLLFYNLTQSNAARYLSNASTVLYGDSVKAPTNCPKPWTPK